jgi:hypothetical protein
MKKLLMILTLLGGLRSFAQSNLLKLNSLLFLFLIGSLSTQYTNAQILGEDLFIPVTINAPFLSYTNEAQFGASINYYGIHERAALRKKRALYSIAAQANNGNVKFDPLKFKDASHLTKDIETVPSVELYIEMAYGKPIPIPNRNMNVFAGIGRQIYNPNTRFFTQFETYSESNLIKAGFALRATYTNVKADHVVFLEPVIQAKIKILNFRIFNQFGYVISLVEDEARPIGSVGLEIVFD